MSIGATGSHPLEIERTADIVSAYVSNNHVAVSDLPTLIARVHAAMDGFTTTGIAVPQVESTVVKPSAAQVRKSVRPDAVVSFLDGKPYKTLKRHLTKHGLDPVSYRAKYGLPEDYPMVSAAYSETRSSLARSLGLGRSNGRAAKVEGASKGKARKRAA